MGFRDRIIRVVGHLSATPDMSPFHTNLVSWLYIEDFVGHWRAVPRVASEVGVVHILDRVVAVRHTNTSSLALVCTIDADILRNTVSSGESREEREGGSDEELHPDEEQRPDRSRSD